MGLNVLWQPWDYMQNYMHMCVPHVPHMFSWRKFCDFHQIPNGTKHPKWSTLFLVAKSLIFCVTLDQFSNILVPRPLYALKNYWDPKELLFMWVVATGMFHIRNGNGKFKNTYILSNNKPVCIRIALPFCKSSLMSSLIKGRISSVLHSPCCDSTSCAASGSL